MGKAPGVSPVSSRALGLRVTADRKVVLPGPEGLCCLEGLLCITEARGAAVRGSEGAGKPCECMRLCVHACMHVCLCDSTHTE